MCGWFVHLHLYIYIEIHNIKSTSVAFLLVYEGDESRRTRRGGRNSRMVLYRRESQTYTHTYTIQSSGAVTQTHTHTRYSLHPAAGPYIGRWVAHLWECLKRKDSYGCPGVASVSSPAVAVRNCLPQAKHPQNRHNLPLKPEAHNNVHEYGANMPYYSLRSQ